MDVYSQSEDRAHGSGFVGIDAESDDAVETLEVYEALLNPREAESSSAQAPGGMPMTPPMMGMGGAGGAAGAAPGMPPAPGAAAAGTAAMGASMLTSQPGLPPAAASTGPGPGTGISGAGIAGPSHLGTMPSTSGLGPGPTSSPSRPDPSDMDPGLDSVSTKPVEAPETVSPGAMGTSADGSAPGLVSVDPAQVEAVASQWSELSRRMASVKGVVGGLAASMSDFGQVRHPAAPYAQMTLGIKTMTGVASEEFELIADGLAYGARSYREQEAAAAKTLGRTQ